MGDKINWEHTEYISVQTAENRIQQPRVVVNLFAAKREHHYIIAMTTEDAKRLRDGLTKALSEMEGQDSSVQV